MSGSSLRSAVKSILKQYRGSLYVPSPATCFQDSAGTTPCTVDSPVGKLLDSVGTNHATQSTAGFKPILRGAVKNYIYNSSMVGAVGGSPGTLPTGWSLGTAPGIAYQVVATGYDAGNGVNYVDIAFSGTATGTGSCSIVFNAANTTAASAGMVFTTAVLAKLIAGSYPASNPVYLNIIERQAGGTLNATWTNDFRSTTQTALTKVSLTVTVGTASTAYIHTGIRMDLTSGVSVNFTIRIASPQLELGSVSSTYVPTTSAPASSSYGPYWLDFDGVDDRLQLGSVPFQLQDNPFGAMSGQYFPDASVNRRMLSVAGTTSAIAVYAASTSGNSKADFIDDAAVTATLSGSDNLFTQGKIVPSFSDLSNAKTIYKNSVSLSTSSLSQGNSTNTSAYIGNIAAGTAALKGSLYCVIVGKGAISTQKLRKLEKYAGKLAGVSL